MVEPNTQPKGAYLKKIINYNNPLFTAIGSIIIIAISVFLISKCFSINNRQYQSYQDNIIQLQKIDADFNQAVLKSRYELFTSYDPLVRNLQQQRSLLKELVDFPDFISLNTRTQLNEAFKEMNTSLKQKIELSDRFKSRNALLKNSLRYLPSLTNQLESKLDETDQNLTPIQIANLGSNLNRLIRQLLIYNVVVDREIQAEIESLRNDLLQLKIESDLAEEKPPTQVSQILNQLIAECDRYAEQYGLEKQNTIWGNYVAVCGLSESHLDQSQRTLNVALKAIEAIAQINQQFQTNLAWRIAIHSGKISAGIIGEETFAYKLWGKTAEIVTQLNTNGANNSIIVTQPIRERLSTQ